MDCAFTIHGAEARDGDHDGEEDAAQGAKEGATKVQSDGITPGNGILSKGLSLILWEKAITYFVKDSKVSDISEGEQCL